MWGGGYQQVLQDNYIQGSMSQLVSGQNRPMYFKRPLVPQMNDLPIVVTQPKIDVQKQQVGYQEEEYIEPKTKDAEMQTMFRESEAQTDPFTPKYFVKDGDKPEVLMIKHFKYGKELPATIEELQLIENERERVWFENSLPPISDEASFILRRKLMEAQEMREWSKKEDDIKKIGQEKLHLIQSALIEKEKDQEEKNAIRIEEIKSKKTEQKNRLIAKIQRRKIKILRKMNKQRKQMDQESSKRDIISDYANFASRVYAGITREGLSLDKIANKYEVQPGALTNYTGMQELSETIKPNHLETKVNVKKELVKIQKNYTRMEDAHIRELKKAEQQIQLQNNQPKKDDLNQDKAKNNDKKNNPRVRSETVHAFFDKEGKLVLDISEKNEVFLGQTAPKKRIENKRELAVILLQRLIRGRYIQNIMYEGKEKRMALIDELLTVAKIPNLADEEAEEILMQDHEEKVKNALLEAIQGEFISETMDQLSKELLRVKQERKIASLVETAERDRRLREIEEAGKRQAEQKLREREDVVYNEILRVHQGTVDTYLDWIFQNTIDKASTRQATIMANLRKDKMDKPLEQFERKFSKNETIIKDLVHAFLIPNVQRSKIQRQIEIEEKRFSEAAKKSLFKTVQQASNNMQADKK